MPSGSEARANMAALKHSGEEPAQEGPNCLFSNELEFQDGDTGMHSGRVLVHITHSLDKASLSLLRFTEAVLQRLPIYTR